MKEKNISTQRKFQQATNILCSATVLFVQKSLVNLQPVFSHKYFRNVNSETE